MGSGIQGVCCSIAFASAGYDVIILEQDREIFSRTTKK